MGVPLFGSSRACGDLQATSVSGCPGFGALEFEGVSFQVSVLGLRGICWPVLSKLGCSQGVGLCVEESIQCVSCSLGSRLRKSSFFRA